MGCSWGIIALMLGLVVAFLLLVPYARDDSGFLPMIPIEGLVICIFGPFLLLLALAFYFVWTTFVDKKRNRKRAEPPKSRFVVTKDGDIMELMEDEKPKRSTDSTVED
jgi:uncharacterized membrane protein